MNRLDMESAIADRVVASMKTLGLLGGQKENEVRMDIMISLRKGASDENLRDMIGFIRFGQLHKKSPEWITGNLMHDINGLVSYEPWFSPRTTGYDTV